MRINLKVPYVEKDEAKSLGAKWDAGRKTWYLEDREDLTPFMRWIEGGYSPPTLRPAKKPGRRERQLTKHAKSYGITVSEPVEHCGCYHVLSWEDCEHTAVYAASLDADSMAHLRSI